MIVLLQKIVSVHALEDAQNGPTSRVLLLSSIHGGKILVMFNSTSDPDGDGGPCLYIKFHSIRGTKIRKESEV